ADGRHGASEIKSRAGERHLRRAPTGGGVEQMVVHPDETRDDSAPRKVHRSRTGRRLHARRRPDVRDAAVLNDDRLVRLRRRARAIDDGYVRERYDWFAHAHVLLADLLRELR